MLEATLLVRGRKSKARGRILAADPAGFDARAKSCAPGRHAAVWRLFLEAKRSSLKLPLFVERARRGSGADYASWRVVACPAADDPRLVALSLRIDRVFRNPWKKGAYTWRAVTSPLAGTTGLPNDSRSVESRSSVLLPVKLTFRAGRYTFGQASVDLEGVLMAGGRPVPVARFRWRQERGRASLSRRATQGPTRTAALRSAGRSSRRRSSASPPRSQPRR